MAKNRVGVPPVFRNPVNLHGTDWDKDKKPRGRFRMKPAALHVRLLPENRRFFIGLCFFVCKTALRFSRFFFGQCMLRTRSAVTCPWQDGVGKCP